MENKDKLNLKNLIRLDSSCLNRLRIYTYTDIENRKTVENMVAEMLPCLSDEEKKFINNLPEEYVLDVPYVLQEEKHWSGAAVVQMIDKFFNRRTVSQRQIINEAGWQNYRLYDHSTFREKIARYLLKNGYLYSQYYPANYIAPKMKSGIEATDFIRANSEIIAAYDFSFFKALLVARRAPLIARVHFTQKQYNMPEKMMERLDVSGHCVLVIGYNKKGFILHDPWDKEKWGGEAGGAYQIADYTTLVRERQFVDSTSDYVGAADKVVCYIPIVKESVHEGKTIPVRLVVEWPGVYSITGEFYGVQNISAKISKIGAFMKVRDKREKNCSEILYPGRRVSFEWMIDVGNKDGSYPIEIEARGEIHSPNIPWENHTKSITAVVSMRVAARICVFKKEFLKRFSRHDKRSGK